MPTDVNLGRVQGMGWWFADATFTTSGTITLQAGFTIEPYIGDYVVDTTNGNVYAIATISGTNPFSFTTNGTVIYTIKSASDNEWDDVIEIGPLNPQQVVSDEIVQKLQTFINILKSNTSSYLVIETSARGYNARYSSVRASYVDFTGGIFYSYTSDHLFWGDVNDTHITYDPSNKFFSGNDSEHFTLYGAYIKYKVVTLTAQQNYSYNLQDINAVATQETDNTYNFDNENFKTELQQKPHLVFLTINEHEFKGFFIDNGVYKHVDNVYNYNEETKENELIKTYTCLIDINQNLITYKEEQAE